MRSALLLSGLILLASPLAASADAPANTIMKVTPPDERKNDATVECIAKYRMELARLGALANEIKPTPEQKSAFDAWRTSRIDLFKATPCPAPPMGLEVPAPKRIETQITIMSATLDALRKELPAAKALYSVLTPEQRKIFDGPVRLAVPPPAAPPPAPPAGH